MIWRWNIVLICFINANLTPKILPISFFHFSRFCKVPYHLQNEKPFPLFSARHVIIVSDKPTPILLNSDISFQKQKKIENWLNFLQFCKNRSFLSQTVYIEIRIFKDLPNWNQWKLRTVKNTIEVIWLRQYNPSNSEGCRTSVWLLIYLKRLTLLFGGLCWYPRNIATNLGYNAKWLIGVKKPN